MLTYGICWYTATLVSSATHTHRFIWKVQLIPCDSKCYLSHLILFCLYYLFMKDKLSFSDLTSFSRFSHRFNTACISEGTDGVKFLSFASAILHHKEVIINKGFKFLCNLQHFQLTLICIVSWRAESSSSRKKVWKKTFSHLGDQLEVVMRKDQSWERKNIERKF